jgi:PTH1 family peptidyl-tRNA hydrolase
VPPIVLVGLGNPGEAYEGTRHNIGFAVIDELARRFNIALKAGAGEYVMGQYRTTGHEVILSKPLTYMNNSGAAVAELLERARVTPAELMVIADDLAIPLGTVRVRAKGGDGGHNGLFSIIYQLQSNGFPRCRCGIGREAMPPREKISEFVLSPFDEEEEDAAKEMISRAGDAAMDFATNPEGAHGIGRTMNRFNTRRIVS